jgi:hypothetical protein
MLLKSHTRILDIVHLPLCKEYRNTNSASSRKNRNVCSWSRVDRAGYRIDLDCEDRGSK